MFLNRREANLYFNLDELFIIVEGLLTEHIITHV